MTLPRSSLATTALFLFALAFVLLFGLTAHAEEVAIIGAPPPSGLGGVLLGFLTPSGIASALAVVLGLVGSFSFFDAKRKRILALATYYAFHIVEDVVADLADGPVKNGFNKTQEALKQIDAYMLANGYRQLKVGEVAVATQMLSAQHGIEVAKAKVAVAAALAAPSPQ